MTASANTGTLYGIGTGPGDPELLTLKAARLIAACLVCAYPQADSKPSLARRIAAAHLPAGVQERPYALPMSPDGSAAQQAYDALAAQLAEDLTAGCDVAVLCEGDPLFYGSFAEVMHRLAGRFAVQVVPGIPSAHAAAAALPLALVQRNASYTVLPAPLPDDRLEARLAGADAAAIMKLGRHFPRIRVLLDRLGLTDFAYYCEHVGQPEQRLMPLADAGTTAAPYFALILLRKPAA